MEKKRILWLHNHTSLRKFEVPLLLELGYEVFCPKIFQVGAGDGSASVTYEYDNSLSIEKDKLELLNQVDFYENISRNIMEIVNENFDIVMLHYFPQQLQSIVRNFKGVIVFQAFGLLQERSYTNMILADLGIATLEKIKSLGQRFFFAQAHPHLKNIECKFFQQRSIDLPIGLPRKKGKEWVGGDERFLFVLPGINTSKYFQLIYADFKKNFSGMDYIIAGAQPIAVQNDDNVSGFMSNEEYTYIMNHASAMYYHSTEKNHIHYHPFEAIQNGMPVIFMAGGMMDLLGGIGLPGRCRNINEAKKKLKKLVKGDSRLRKDIIRSQEVLLKHFDYEHCKQLWDEQMKCITYECSHLDYQKKEKKIAIIMPQPYLGGVLDYTLRVIKCLLLGAKEDGRQSISIVFGYPDDECFKGRKYFEAIEDENVSFRPFTWRNKKKNWIDTTCQLMNITQFNYDECCVLDDGMNYFEDCDYLIFTADRIPENLFTTRYYTVVAHDYIQRYVPELFGNDYEAAFIENARKADSVWVTTTATQQDAIQYAGISAEKIRLTPMMFDFLKISENYKLENELKEEYFLWSTNIAQHKNHKKALEALLSYYEAGGRLNCVVTGANTGLLDIQISDKQLDENLNPYVGELREIIRQNDDLKKWLIIKGNLPKKQYEKILSKAKFVFHPGFADNGNGTAIDAACLGIPTICSDYPAMRYVDQYIGLGIHFFNPFDEKSIAEMLEKAEKNCAMYAKELPSRDVLKKFTVEGIYPTQYQIIMNTVEGYF